VLAGIVLGAWIDDFQHVSVWTLGVIAVLAVLAWAVDYVAAVLGAKRAGASRLAMLGAAIGTVAGLLMGLVGVLFMPLVGAIVGEVVAQRQQRSRERTAGVVPPDGDVAAVRRQALRVGLATWIGLLLGTVAKLVLVFMMIGVFVAALLV
jgi:uncharacterized protein YqgC (DUF456 family)